MPNFDLLSIGDASLDVFMTPTESETLCQLKDKECHICFSYGDKIPVKNFEFCVGGNAANNAVGVTRLGIKTGLVLTLGEDLAGSQIMEKLQSEGVNMDFVVKQTAASSNYSTIINYSGERTIFTYHAPRSYEFPVSLPAAPWVYLTSMGESFKPFYNHMVDFLRVNTKVKLAFNPGSWQIRAGMEGMGDILKLTEVLYINREEAEKIAAFEGDSHGKEKDLLEALVNLGPRTPIITDGNNGSYCLDGGSVVRVGVLPVDAYERTGAGDAFGSGCLAAIIKGKPMSEALLWGTANSASVIGYVGSQKGLLTETEMQVWLDRAKTSEVIIETL